jgi:predicted nuclease of predicted toxin-antitoxin system
VKLLFDQNLSPKLVAQLADVFPASEHVEDVGLGAASDELVWEYARVGGLAIVSKDEDYSHLSVFRGSPPKVLWLLTGNCTAARVEELLRTQLGDILAFESDASVGVLALG